MSTSIYTPGTKLSYANGTECCTVLTNGNSLVTKVWGQDHWEQMWLADWLILANGDEREEFIPVDDYSDMPPLIPLNQVYPTELPPGWVEVKHTGQPYYFHRAGQISTYSRPDAAATVEADAQATLLNDTFKKMLALPKRPLGTKLKWVSKLDTETYRIAVVTKDGVCQVKAITEGGGDCYYDHHAKKTYLTKRSFTSETAWRQSLPQGGEVSVY